MKVLILAADSYATTEFNVNPSCFDLKVGDVSLIEYHVRTLRMLGFQYSDITIVTGLEGVWKNKSIFQKIRKNGVKEVKVDNFNKRSYESLKFYLKMKNSISDLLVINGDTYFNLNDLEGLLHADIPSTALVERKNNVYTRGLKITSDANEILKVKAVKNHKKVPWESYYGALLLTKSDIKIILKSDNLNSNSPYMCVLVNQLKLSIRRSDVNKKGNGVIESSKTIELTGGSFANLKKLVLVKKFSDSTGNDKLISEIEWLNQLPSYMKDKFPVVVDYKIGAKGSWFTMPWYDLENLRSKVLSGKFSTKTTLYFLEKILDYMFKEVYSKKFSDPGKGWTQEKHFDRFYSRIEAIRLTTPFNYILKVKSIIINGKSYLNLETLVSILDSHQKQTNLFSPDELVMVHGDLHFQNMLIDTENDSFVLADPRGEALGSDIYYDMGKLWHSVNGLYDLIHTDISQATVISKADDQISFTFDMGGHDIKDTYKDIKKGVDTLMCKYTISKDPNWRVKTEFAEVMHFSSLMYFHLKYDQNENRAVCLYLQSIILASKLVEKLELSK